MGKNKLQFFEESLSEAVIKIHREAMLRQKKVIIDKACKWLTEKIDEDVLIKCGSVVKCIDAVEFSEYFRKAMEE